MKKLIISSAIILAAVGITWLISIGGWFFLNILIILVVIPHRAGSVPTQDAPQDAEEEATVRSREVPERGGRKACEVDNQLGYAGQMGVRHVGAVADIFQ